MEYAENLKAELGEFYEADFDKLALKQRIEAMKIVKKAMSKLPIRSEGKAPRAPEPDINKNRIKTHVERWEAGEKQTKSPNFNITLLKSE